MKIPILVTIDPPSAMYCWTTRGCCAKFDRGYQTCSVYGRMLPSYRRLPECIAAEQAARDGERIRAGLSQAVESSRRAAAQERRRLEDAARSDRVATDPVIALLEMEYQAWEQRR